MKQLRSLRIPAGTLANRNRARLGLAPADLFRAICQALAQATAKDALGRIASCGYSFCSNALVDW
jgi:hypothetical protein